MSIQSPHRLLKLAIQSLLTDKALAMRAMEDLPGELFPPVFMEAFTRGHTEVLKAMVLSWPFPYLPVGALISMWKSRKLNTQVDVVQVQKKMLQAVLGGVDVLLSQKLCSRRLKLQVLDMRDENWDFWRVWAANELEERSSELRRKRKTEKTPPKIAKQQTLTMTLDLWLSEKYGRPFQSYLLKWAQERKDLMRNLHKLVLCEISVIPIPIIHPEKRDQWITQIMSQLHKLGHLQEIYMKSVSFMEGHLDLILRCLTCPLETLSLTYCLLSHTDWNRMPHLEITRHLKHLDLSYTRLTDLCPEPLQILLENVAATLSILHLENCGITDAQLSALLPALSCCSQLTAFCFIRNFISIDTTKSLLCHTARMSNLRLELHSVPQEVYIPWNGVNQQIQNHNEDVYKYTEHVIHYRDLGQWTFSLTINTLPMFSGREDSRDTVHKCNMVFHVATSSSEFLRKAELWQPTGLPGEHKTGSIPSAAGSKLWGKPALCW
ncbi:PRAME family member 12-like [Cavia porcellus]|uniref:PRAME family member 12-like n=1 Tax=Cavia porcellus TaxID=10141 RepID=UPI000C8796CA|nr:PRAME family member 12-like [Cavia porcellus]